MLREVKIMIYLQLYTLLVLGTLLTLPCSGQNLELSRTPIYFIDSVRVDATELQKYEPAQIASVTIIKDRKAVEWLGEESKSGVIFIETKNFARMRYSKYFSTKSIEYANLVSKVQSDDQIQYILNDKVLIENFEGDLSMVNDSTFRELRVLNKKQLKKEFNVKDRKYGVLVTANKPGL